MTNISESIEIDNFLSFLPDFLDTTLNKKRQYTRYLRDDIYVVISKIDTLSGLIFNHFSCPVPVDLIDISSKGILIASDKKLKCNAKILLELKFSSGKTFQLEGVIIWKLEAVQETNIDKKRVYKYGLKLNKYNNELGDYLLNTQIKLKFK